MKNVITMPISALFCPSCGFGDLVLKWVALDTCPEVEADVCLSYHCTLCEREHHIWFSILGDIGASALDNTSFEKHHQILKGL